jgi:hypothetical protein
MEAIKQQIVEQGNIVRQLKAAKADKTQVDAAVQKLLDLKRQLAELTGESVSTDKQKGKTIQLKTPKVRSKKRKRYG